MTPLGHLEFNSNSFDFEETNIYGIFEPHGNMTWHIEMFPAGEDNYIMLNSLFIEQVFSPQRLSGIKYQATNDESGLYDHTVRVDGRDRYLQSIEMVFGNWDTKNQSIQLSGQGIIEPDDNLPEVSYVFNAILKFKELNIFETTKEATQKFVETHLQDSNESLEIKFEDVPSGLQATIGGRF